MRRREILRSSAFLTLGAIASGMLESCAPETTTTTSAPKPPLRVAMVPWVGWGSLQIAEVKGFFQAEGIEVKQTVFQTVTEVNTALLAGQMDLAWLVATDLLLLVDKLPDLKFIFAADYSGDVDAIVGFGINSPADLKTKKFAREDIPYEVVFSNKYLESVGLTEKDVQILSLPVPDATAAFVAGKVDVAVLYEPFVGKALKGRPGAKRLFTGKGSNIIVNGLAGGAVLKTRRDDVLAYLRAIAKGIKFGEENPQEANEILAKWTGVSAAEVADQLKQVRRLNMAENKAIVFNPSEPLHLVSSFDSAAQILLKTGKISKVLPGMGLIDDSFVKAL
jgi:NitT/TauT family transport system substrate-binding protein